MVESQLFSWIIAILLTFLFNIRMKLVLPLLPIVICCLACNQQVVKKVSSISTDEQNFAMHKTDSVKKKGSLDNKLSEITFILKDSNKIVDSEIESTHELFTVKSAISRGWISGVYGGGSGTEYTITITILTSKQLDFDSLWLNNSLLKLFVAQESSISNKQINIKKGDEITLRASDIHNNKNAISNIRPPFNFIGEALLYFRVNDERKYYIVSEIQNQPTIYHK